MAGIRDEIKRAFQEGNALMRLIYINLGVFIVYILLRVISSLLKFDIADIFIDWTALPSNLSRLITRPWTLFTYMFLHQGFLHILFNLLYLYFAGRLFMEHMGGRRLLSTYILGGLAGGALYVISYNIFPMFNEAVIGSDNRGASAGVMAVVIAIATYIPNFRVRLFFTLEVKLWILAALLLLMDLIYLGEGNNPGGHIAHLGGALFGYLFIRRLQAGKDITEGFSSFMDNIANWFKPRPKIKKVYARDTQNDRVYHENKAYNQQKVDDILDKISKSGYDSLSKEEKDFLFKFGKDQ